MMFKQNLVLHEDMQHFVSPKQSIESQLTRKAFKQSRALSKKVKVDRIIKQRGDSSGSIMCKRLR